MAQESKVVDSRNQNRVLFKGNEDDARDFVERNFPRHHVDPAAPAMESPEPDVLFVGSNGKQEMYLGPEEAEPWQAVGHSGGPQDKVGGKA
jgi:hypothetical protein